MSVETDSFILLLRRNDYYGGSGAVGDFPPFHSSILPIPVFLVDAGDELLYWRLVRCRLLGLLFA